MKKQMPFVIFLKINLRRSSDRECIPAAAFPGLLRAVK